MKVFKIIPGLILAVLVVGAIVVIYGLQNLDRLIKETVEQVGTEVVGTQVKLGSAKVELSDGKAQLNDLTVHNPVGFSDASIFKLGEISAQIDLNSLTGDVIVIKSVVIDKMSLLAEQKGLTDTNLQTVLDNLKKNSVSTTNTKDSKPTDSKGADVKLAVESFRFSESELEIKSEQFGEQYVNLPTIQLNNLGSKDNGLTPEQLGELVIKRLTAEAKAATRKKLEALAKKKAEEKLNEKLKEKLGEDDMKALDQLKGMFGK